MFVSTIAILCIVGNADVRFEALVVWCCNIESKNRDTISPISPKLCVSYRTDPGSLDANDGDIDLTHVYQTTIMNPGAVAVDINAV